MESVTPPDWPTADRAYQQHHAACPQCRRDQRAVIGNHSFQGADFISVLLSSSCEFFRLAISFSV